MSPPSPVLLLPGLLCDQALWAHQVHALSEVTSVHVADLTRDDDIRQMAARILREAPDRFALAGLSMGGYVAFEILRQAPERVTRLALLNTSAAGDDAQRVAQRHAAIQSLQIGRFAGVTHRLLPQLIHPLRIQGPLADAVRAMAERVGQDAFIRQERTILSRPDSRPLLANLRIPTVVAVGDSDVLTPLSDTLDIHRGISGSALQVFPQCGHLPALECPRETSALLHRWLTAPDGQVLRLDD